MTETVRTRVAIVGAGPAGLMLAHRPAEQQEQLIAGPLAALTPETITQPEALRRKLAEVRRLGHAVMPGTVEAVSTGVAVPVRDATGTVIAALSVVLPREQAPATAIAALREAAEEVRATLASGAR